VDFIIRGAGVRSPRRHRHYRYAVAVSALAVLANYVGILPVFRAHLQGYLTIGDAQFGLLFSVAPLAGALTVLASGFLLNRFGAVRLIRFSLWGVAAGLLLLTAAGRCWPAVLVGVTLSTLATGPFAIAMNAYLTRLFPRDHRRILSLGLAVGSAGGMALPLLAELLLSLSARWPALSFGLILRGPCLLVGLILLTAGFSYRGRPVAAPHPARPEISPWAWRQFILPLPVAWLVGLMALHTATDVAIFTWMPRFLDSRCFPRHPLAPGVVLAGMAAAYLVSRAGLAALPEAWGRRTLLILPGLLGGGMFVTGVITRSFGLTVGGYLLGAFLWSAEYPAMLGAAADRGRQSFGTALALTQVLSGLFTAAFVYALGQWVAHQGEERMWLGMALLGGGFLCVGLGGALWVTGTRPKHNIDYLQPTA
jgi:MFS family permease